jgi:hypothetical protein
MAKVQEQVKQYQWIKGDNFGNIVTVKDEDSQFINFTDGSRIFKTVKSEFLKEVVDGNIPLPGASSASLLATGSAIQKPTIVGEINMPSKVEKSETSIMGKMITKMSKKNVVNVPIQINLNIPTPAIHSILSEGLEEEDLNDEIMEVALSQIEMDKLQEYIKSNIAIFLSEYYT